MSSTKLKEKQTDVHSEQWQNTAGTMQGNGSTYAVAWVWELDVNKTWNNSWNSNDHICEVS